mmetsp:Transcript_10964/g.23657  ORF Transcript_10964/g.23657 Transcript_10964/m.23657 type:complete len:125 (+) Transcript_10964:3321-3695(+)
MAVNLLRNRNTACMPYNPSSQHLKQHTHETLPCAQAVRLGVDRAPLIIAPTSYWRANPPASPATIQKKATNAYLQGAHCVAALTVQEQAPAANQPGTSSQPTRHQQPTNRHLACLLLLLIHATT